MAIDPNKVIYSMIGVSKVYDKKPVLKDIYLSYFYGAKIGVLGLNGSGKSSLLRILAGVDTDFIGKTILSPGHTVGFLEQEPQLDDTKTVREIVEQGVQETVDLMNEFNEINEKFAEPMDDAAMNKLLDRQAKVQEKLDALDAWDLDSRLEMAMDALRCPPGETPVKVLSGGERRRVALCRLLLQNPDILLLDEPTNHLDAESVAWLEHHLQAYPGTVIAVTHDRYFLDNVAGWILELDRGQGIPWKGNYSSWLEQKQNRLQPGGKIGERAAEDPPAGTGVDPDVAQGAPRQVQGPDQLLREPPGPGDGRPREGSGDLHPARTPPGQARHRGGGGEQGLRRPPPGREHVLRPAARRDRRDHRPERRREDDPLPDDHRPGEARLRDDPDRRDGQAGLRGPEPRRPRPGQDDLGDDLRGAGHHPAREPRGELPGLCRPASTSREPTSRRRSARSPAASGTASIWPGCSRRGRTSCSSTSRPTTWT